MPFFADEVLDGGLDYIDANVDKLVICSQEPVNYTEANSTYKLGEKASPTVSAPADRGGGGREVTVSAISDGTVTASGTATHIALLDTGNTALLVTQALASSQAVATGSPFTLTEFDCYFNDPT